ncbi:hypothetical protein BD780_000070 [Clostridium tetanomorphum]|uniref:hypothetical protein n=1 Tax=Clostridium tetanomorphum TaxID=1553 RepID=UPI0004534E41|nr:hypothetical protein [Clostridium tetanomorphum]KAJ48710.1 hypothetical protein CTM_26905 [Clostridium tetanomorphum DSM 665]KAJ52096.1 hypothetical protein CTM_09996 [Clostridium tetanomorphum DSM 665]MBP1863016.1 lipopolysaccharide export LptBFGC system permease protein LptF [Clostridium tetanomorphum]NRS82845.1 hypothetical protein [Clostridium tetanomorphum]SQC03213.1 Uncharacterised protein [Clostridium tetanomorphum]
MKMFKKVILAFFVVLIVLVIGSLTFPLSKNGYQKGDNSSIEGISKVREGEKKGEKVTLNSKELNNIFAVVYKNNKKLDNIVIKTPEAYVKEDKIGIKIPVEIKGMEFIASSEGTLKYENDNVIYTPEFFKVGKLNLPKNFVINKIKEFKNLGITVEDGNIKLNKNKIPFSIKDLYIENGTLTISMNKFSSNTLFKHRNNVKIELSKLKEQLILQREKSPSEEEKREIDKIITQIEKDNPSQQLLDKVNRQIKENNNISQEIKEAQNKNNSDKVQALSRVRDGLSKAMGQTGSEEGKKIIGMMISTINKMISDAAYDYNGDAVAVRSIYSKLSPQKKASFKSAIFSNVDGGSIMELRNAFGI